MGRLLIVRKPIPIWYGDFLERRHVNDRHYRYRLSGEHANVWKPDHSLLLKVRRGILSKSNLNHARSTLRKVGTKFSGHRGYHSGVVGYLPENGEYRQTAFSRDHPDEEAKIQPLIREVDSVYQHFQPYEHAAQRAVAERIEPDPVFGSTAFTTVTANTWDNDHDARTPVHADSGDLPKGFGVITVLGSGWEGGELIFPRYRVAVDLREGDVLFADVHEFHGNAPITNTDFERTAVIFYCQAT